MSKKAKFSRILAAIAIAFALVSCGGGKIPSSSPAQSAPERTLRFGYVDTAGISVPTGVVGIAHKFGIFEEEFAKENAKFELIGFRNAGPGINAALASDSVDMGSLGDIPALVAKSGGVGTVLVAGNLADTDTYLVVQADSAFAKASDLAGKSVATQIGSYMQRTLYLFLAEAGLSASDIEFVNMNATDSANALAAKQVDAVVVPATNAMRLVDEGLGRAIASTQGHPDWLNGSCYVASDKFAAESPDLIVAFCRSLLRAKEYGQAHPEELRQLLIDAGNAEKIVDLAYPDGKFATDTEASEAVRSAFARVSAFMVENGLAENLVDIEAWYNPAFYEEGLKEYSK
jgi:aliphatic sulfonates family ABC transporter substrate-binding protein